MWICFSNSYVYISKKWNKKSIFFLLFNSIDGPDFGTFNYKKKTKIDHWVDSVKIFSKQQEQDFFLNENLFLDFLFTFMRSKVFFFVIKVA